MRQPERRAEILAQLNPMLFRDRHKNFDHFRIELAAGTPLDFLSRMRHRKCPAIRPVANHGVERVSDSKDARPQGNLVGLQAARIAGAVEKLLVRQDNFRGIAKEWDARSE